MKKNYTLALFALVLISGAFAQTSSDQPRLVVENQYMFPKRGMEDKFEAAIKAHNIKFHPDGPFKAGLRKVDYGEKAGWYVWIYGPTAYENIDKRPSMENGHDEDWSKNVDPLVETYGDLFLSEFNNDLSFGKELLAKAGHYELWMVDLKRGQYYRFKALAENLKKAYASLGTTAFLVYDNVVHVKDGFDVALVWSFDSYAGWAKDPGPKEAYEKLFGAGSWQHMLDDWMDITVDYSSEIRSFVK